MCQGAVVVGAQSKKTHAVISNLGHPTTLLRLTVFRADENGRSRRPAFTALAHPCAAGNGRSRRHAFAALAHPCAAGNGKRETGNGKRETGNGKRGNGIRNRSTNTFPLRDRSTGARERAYLLN